MLKVLSKSALNLQVYKTASCAEVARNYFHHWINMTCEFKEIGTKNSKLAKEKEILARTLMNKGVHTRKLVLYNKKLVQLVFF